MMDVLGRYQLELPAGWGIRGTHKKLNGLVIGDGTESFIAVYIDGSFTIDDVAPTMRGLCGCTIPKGATYEVLENSAYPSQIIVYKDDESTLAIGASVFPEGMFGLVAILKSETTVAQIRSVLTRASPGPSRAK